MFAVMLFIIFLSVHPLVMGQRSGGMYAQGPGGNNQNKGGSGGGDSQKMGKMGKKGGADGNLPPGYANIRGEIMDMSNKVIQRVTSAGSNYFTYDNQNGAPAFKRREMDTARRFVLFPDVQYPLGDGHYIVLRRLPGVNIPGMVPQPLYEVFRLALGDSVHAMVEMYNPKGPTPGLANTGTGFNGLAAQASGQSGGYGISNTPQNSKGGGR